LYVLTAHVTVCACHTVLKGYFVAAVVKGRKFVYRKGRKTRKRGRTPQV